MTRLRIAACAMAVLVVSAAGVGDAWFNGSRADGLAAERATAVLGAQVARPGLAADGVTIDAIEPVPVEPAAPSPSEVSEVMAPPPAAFVANPGAAAVRPPAAPRRPLPEGQGGTWALVVGINDYPGDAHDLRFAVNDANDVDAVLQGVDVAADRRLVLRDGQATGAAIAAGLDWLVDHAGTDAVAVVSFAGHAREHGRGRQAFVAADGIELSDRELAVRLAPLRARATWLNFATCYAGGFDELLAEGRTLVAAAPAGQLAYENTAIGRSYLGEYMVRRALRSSVDGDVRAAFAAARDAIRRDYPDRVPVESTASTDLVVRLRPPSTNPEPTRDSTGSPPAPAPKPPADETDACAGATFGVVTCR